MCPETRFITPVYSCDFYLFNNKNQVACPDLSDFLAADVWSYEHQADLGLLFSAGPVFENTECVVVNIESVRLFWGFVEAAGQTTHRSASVHTPASHPRSSSYSLLSSESLCRAAQTHITHMKFSQINHFKLQPLLYCIFIPFISHTFRQPSFVPFLNKIIENTKLIYQLRQIYRFFCSCYSCFYWFT